MNCVVCLGQFVDSVYSVIEQREIDFFSLFKQKKRGKSANEDLFRLYNMYFPKRQCSFKQNKAEV